MGKKANRKKNLRFATVAIDGREWDFEVPPYLLGRLKRGSLVAIRRDGWYGVGEVVGLRASTPHSAENVRLIVDKVKEGRWERVSDRKAEARDLMAAAERRAAEVSRLDELARLSERDPQLKGIMDMLAESSDDPALG